MEKIQRLSLEGHNLSLLHILDIPLSKPLEQSVGGPADIVVFGDTHASYLERMNGVLLINPGSATLPTVNHRMDLPGTVGLLDISNGNVEAEIVTLD
jgi:putative phosphoesterase